MRRIYRNVLFVTLFVSRMLLLGVMALLQWLLGGVSAADKHVPPTGYSWTQGERPTA